MNDKIKWSKFLNGFGKQLLWNMGHDPDHLPRGVNVITDALRNDPTFVATHEGLDGFCRSGLAKVATICQMIVYDHKRGPDGDGQPKMIRRHWYAWFKTQFAQPFADQLEDYELIGGVKNYNDKKWEKLQSVTYAWFVDNAQYKAFPDYCPVCGTNVWGVEDSDLAYWCPCRNRMEPDLVRVTYQDLWVKDDSRMIAKIETELFHEAFIIVAVEKDSLFNDIKPIAEALGARAVISGRGKNSKAATERILREFFYWRARPEWEGQTKEDIKVFFPDKPLIILHLSDYDFDGEAVIGPTFANQARRYTPHVLEARIGIEPRDLSQDELPDVIYQVKVTNKGYVRWAEKKALFWAKCTGCGHKELVRGIHDELCNQCLSPYEEIQVGGEASDTAYGLEVEALPTSAYRRLLVYALLEVLEFDYIVQKLRENAVAHSWDAAERLKDLALGQNETYKALRKELERYEKLEQFRLLWEEQVQNSFYKIAEEQSDLFWWEGDDPELQEFVDHVVEAPTGWALPWRPFDQYARTDLLVEYETEALDELIQAFADEDVDWDQD